MIEKHSAVILYPCYFSNIAHFVALTQASKVFCENEDHFVKQTYRTRAYICGANGKQSLNIPVEYSQNNRQNTKDVRLFHQEPWLKQHWKSLQSAYGTSPFFEFYKDEFEPLFTTKMNFLKDFNDLCFQIICNCLQLKVNIQNTVIFEKNPENIIDLRNLVDIKNEITQDFTPYIQVFNSKFGFISNLSILDLLFNEGPQSLNYLKNQKLSLIS